MFTEEEIKQWQEIKASKELVFNLEKMSKTHKKKRIYNNIIKVMSAAAACIAVIVAVGIFVGHDNTTIKINGQQLDESVCFYDISPASEKQRSSGLTIPVELYPDGKTDVTVSDGVVYTDGSGETKSVTVKEDIMLWWKIADIGTKTQYYMDIDCCGETITVILSYNEEDRSVTVTKEN